MTERTFGHVSGYPEGSWFASRADLSKASVHRPRRAGISGNGREGADSVVLAGRYEETGDFGDEILYTGQGGREPETGQQIGHQAFTRGNLALATSRVLGLPVRVIRGAGLPSPYSPETGYRYDGLYTVVDYWRERGRSGFFLWRFRLRRLSEAGELHMDKNNSGQQLSVVRSICETEAGRQLKELYHYRCQICGARLITPVGPYAEAAHIRPLAAPHNGPDTTENLLCLCPNHHVLFELGSIAIADDFALFSCEGRLTIDFRHRLNKAHLRYHREHCWVNPEEN
jgi:putative restriction endonuclease